jgi:hypothetical protein
MTEAAARRRFAPRVAVVRDRAKEAAAERAGQGSPMPGAGRLSGAQVPTALGLGPGRPLPASERAYFERRLGVDLAPVCVHPDAAAAAELGARGLAAGRDIAIAPGHWHPGTTAFRRLIGHELAHTLQQGESGPSVQLDGEPPLKEAKKEDATDAVSGGLKTVAEQDQKQDQTTGDLTQQIVTALNTPDPIAGIGDYATAYNLLNGLSMLVMLRVLSELAAQFMLEVLISREPPQSVDAPRVSAAITLVRLAHTDAASIQQTELESFARNAQALPADQQQDMLNFASTARQLSPATREGLVAMMASQIPGASPAGLSPAVAQGVTGAVAPGSWNPPGNQPIPFYIGNEAHVGIAASYVAKHPGDPVFTNFIPLSSILQQARTLGLSLNAGSLSESELALKPDILNLAPTRRHLFEVKPTSLQSVGLAEARLYTGLLVAAGIPVSLGPVGEPGTNGALPAPGGIYLFETPEPGVIVYQYRRQRLIEEPVPVTEGEPAYERRWRLAPLTPQQQAVIVTTTATGTMMIIIMILLSPVGA